MLRSLIRSALIAALVAAGTHAPLAAPGGGSPANSAGNSNSEPAAEFTGLPLTLGDTYQKIESTFGKLRLRHTASINDKMIPTVRLPLSGVTLFFDDSFVLNQIRVDKPFGGDFGGAKVGQTKAEVERALGAPDRTGGVGQGEDMTFYYDHDHFTFRLDFAHVAPTSADASMPETRVMTMRLIRTPVQ